MQAFLHGLHFVRPEAFLWMIPALILGVAFWWLDMKLGQKARKEYGEERLVSRLTQPLRRLAEAAVLCGWLAFVALLFTAIAGPVSPDAPTKVSDGSLQVVFLTDVSRSMAAEDYRDNMPPVNGVAPSVVPGPYGTRLDMAKLIMFKQLLPALVGNQVGVATYMGEGWDVADLTNDFSYVRDSIDELVKILNAPGGGSDYSEGLKMALHIFAVTPDPGKDKVIVWFTDGGFTGKPEDLPKVIDQVKEANVHVIIIGMGADSPAPIPVYDDETGQQTQNVQRDGKTVTTQIQEDDTTDKDGHLVWGLKSLQENLGPNTEYIRLVPGQDLGIHWASKLSGTHAEPHEADMFQYPLGAAMILVIILLTRGVVGRVYRLIVPEKGRLER
jgi:Ca-activated chloride channel family protein